jgi:eukaryotic-like serine/threonine-protein kinase
MGRESTTRTLPAMTVLGRYRLGPLLGRGATARVYRARDLREDADVAVKVIPAEPERAGRVGAEIRAAMRLDHPGVVALRDWGEDPDGIYLVWELVDGRSLAALLRDGPGDRAVIRVAREVLAALDHAHRRGVVHRDVKPANILVGRDGRARLSDFGVARLSGEAGLTRVGGVVGTMAYMAPEQSRGERVGAAADIYAACLVLYEGLTGDNPICGTSAADTARRAAAGVTVPLAQARPDLPADLVRAVDAGLRRDPERRPDAATLVRALRAAAGTGRAAPSRHAGVLASAAGGAALGALAADRALGWGAGTALVVAAGSGILFAVRPRAAAFLAAAAGVAILARTSPGAAVVIGALGLAILLLGLPGRRLLLLPVAAPALLALGLGPCYALAAGLVRPWRARLWAACAGVACAVCWQILAGADHLLLAGGPVSPALGPLEGIGAPATAARRLLAPLREQPGALIAAAALAAAALCVPAIVRARPGAPRALLVAAWMAALAVGTAIVSPDPRALPVTLGPSAIVLVAWAARPWRPLARRPQRRPSTIRGPAA